MAKIKGQNFRIFTDGVCVAAATSCTMHIAAQTEESSDKDCEGGWVETEVTGHSWDAQSEAFVVMPEKIDEQSYVDADFNTEKTIDGKTFTIASRKRIDVEQLGTNTVCIVASVPTGSTGEGLAIYMERGAERVPELLAYDGNARYLTAVVKDLGKNEAAIYIGSVGSNPEEATLAVYDCDRFEAGQKVGVEFATTSGTMNRTKDDVWVSGEAFVTDVSIQSVNKQNVTQSLQLTGTGKLEQLTAETVGLFGLRGDGDGEGVEPDGDGDGVDGVAVAEAESVGGDGIE